MTLHAGSWDAVPAREALELLAPARDAETGIAAIDHGADAVYIGGPAYGARAAAGNSLDSIARLCGYAHRYHARVFLALNTLFTNEELPAARNLAFEYACAGADALIIQDMGLLAGPLPDIELHASTQCDIRTPEKAAFLESAGFSQVVLARELSLDEIAAARAKLSHARIEFFVHGALCVSYSGQCWMSQALAGRSANRGECAQLCRLPYDVFTQEGVPLARRKHVLSLRDNDQSAHIEALIDAGVSSFKIEGRLKGLAYVKNVTAYYRSLLDAVIARRPELSRTSDGRSDIRFEPSPEKVFNRGKTDYFIHGRDYSRPYTLAELESPKHAGEPAGKVAAVEPDRIAVLSEPGVSFANGDGLTYLADDEEIRGLAVNRAERMTHPDGLPAWALFPSEPPARLEGLRPGLLLRRNRDHAFLKLMDGKTAERRIPVDIIFTRHEDGLDLMMSDGIRCASASVALDLAEPADPEKNIASLRANLSRLGDTPFAAASVYIPDDLDAFIPASIANPLRRAAAEELLKLREADRPKPRRSPWDDAAPYPEKILGFKANVCNDAARTFYASHGASVLAPAFELVPAARADLMTCRHCVRAALSLCPKMLKAFPEILDRVPRERLRPDPLILVNSGGDRFIADFHCKRSPCEMTIRPEGDFVRRRPDRLERQERLEEAASRPKADAGRPKNRQSLPEGALRRENRTHPQNHPRNHPASAGKRAQEPQGRRSEKSGSRQPGRRSRYGR